MYPNKCNPHAMLKPEEVAEHLNVSKRTVMRWIQNDVLPALRIGSVTRIRPADFEAFLQRIHTGNGQNDAPAGRT